jgi:hypothetical protein
VIARNLLKNLAENFFKNQLAMSGKSPAYLHRRKNSKSPRREIGRGFCFIIQRLLLSLLPVARARNDDRKKEFDMSGKSPAYCHRRKI